MRYTQLFGKTSRETPSDVETSSHLFMLKAGLIHQVASGLYSYMPMAWRSLRKIEQIIRKEMETIGAQELRLPALQPQELWDQSGRTDSFGANLFRLKDRKGRLLVLAPTHEELITSMVKSYVHSYRDLPVLLYQIQTKFRDEARPRAGLIRVREFDMKDAYSFNQSEESLDNSYKSMITAYENIYKRCGLKTIIVEADSGAIGGKDSHEFILPRENGEDLIIICPNGDYAANTEKAVAINIEVSKEESVLELKEIYTPNMKTIKQVSEYLDIPANKTLKVIFYIVDTEMILVVLPGDLELNEVELLNALNGSALRMASTEELKANGIVYGFASPVGLKEIKSIADISVKSGYNFVAGANMPDHHLTNVNYPRDFQVNIVTDISLVTKDQYCINCKTGLEMIKGIEVGHIFKLGTSYSQKFDASFLDQNDTRQSIFMGCYGIGVGRLLSAALESNHDDRGIIFPPSLAPYHVNLCLLGQDAKVIEYSEKLYTTLIKAGIEVLYDDREESAGVKFNDADLLGLPIRVVVSKRSLENCIVELKSRSSNEIINVSTDSAIDKIKEMLDCLNETFI